MSEISEESKKKYPKFKSNLKSRKFFTEEFSNKILENYTGKILYLICNDTYLKKPKDHVIFNKKIEVPIAKVYKETQVPTVNRDYVSNEYNICFIIDNTGSMSSWIKVIKDICINLFNEIKEKYDEYIFNFGSVLYADKPSASYDENFKIDFTEDEKEFKSKLEEINIQGGDDCAEDWVSGFKIALEELKWGNGTKLIFHIADAPQHGKTFNINKESDNFLNDENDEHGKNLIKLIKNCSEKNIKIIGININNVGSFKVFKEEYEKVNGPNYEIIDVNGEQLIDKKNPINKKMFDIIEKSINKNKAKKYLE